MPVLTGLPDRVNVVAKPLPEVKGSNWTMHDTWLRWIRTLVATINGTTQRIGSVVSVTDQSVAIPLTVFAVAEPGLTRGMYRVSMYSRITQAAGMSSSLDLTVEWVDGGVTCSYTTPSEIGNLTDGVVTVNQLIHADAGSDIRYAVGYASAGVPSMEYSLAVVVEDVAVGSEIQ